MKFKLFFVATALVCQNTADAMISIEMMEAKNASRLQVISSSGRNLNSPTTELLENLLDKSELVTTGGEILKRPHQADTLRLQSANLQTDVWSGYAWPMFTGYTSLRFGLPETKHLKSFTDAWQISHGPNRSYYEIAIGTDSNAFANLSPAEKYDLLISDPLIHKSGILSRQEWSLGKSMQRRYGSVPLWYGYCHGWAAASFSVPRPVNSVDVISADGKRKIRFYPADIKALVTALWGNALPPTRLIGSRCDIKKPAVDKYGRVINSKCLSVNPGIFHFAVINQVGIARRPLVIDSFYDVEVWNFPITEYRYSYFNPETGKAVNTLSEGTVTVKNFPSDRFHKWRSRKTASVVGVVMQVVYSIGSLPEKNNYDNPKYDSKFTNSYSYDLELDSSGAIVGGEWHQLHHPDFLWTTVKGKTAKSGFENHISDQWTPDQSLPLSWRSAAIEAARKGKPLSSIVEKLVSFARDDL